MSGYFRTALLLAAMTALFMAVGFFLGGGQGMMIALLVALAMNAFAYWNSDSIVLRMHGAREVDARNQPELFNLVGQLAQRAGLPMPRVYIMENEQPNAFATGRSPEKGAVAVTTGLIRILDRDEAAGVIAHELAHIKNRDTLIMTITATLAGALGMLANFGMFFGSGSNDNRNNPFGMVGVILMMFLAPFAAMVVQMAISRSREYEADREGAEICGQPLWLADALGKLDHAAKQIDNPTAEARPATAHLFIVNPLHGRRMDSLFSTHPSLENRIARLRAMAGQPGVHPGHVPQAATRRSGPWG